MVPRINKPNLFQLASRRWSQRTPAAQTRCPAPFHSGAFAPAAILGLLTLPAAAAGLDPAKVNADATAQRTLEAIDAAHHLQSLGTLAHYVLAADAQGQTCTLEDKGNDIFMMECAPAPQHPKYSLLLTGENGRLLAVSMYGADSHLLPTGDAFEHLTAIAPVEPEIAPPAKAAVIAPADNDDFLPGLPHSVDLANGIDVQTRFWASDQEGKGIDLGAAADLDAAVHRKGGRCVTAGTPDNQAEFVCRFPNAHDPRPASADELDIEALFSRTDCLHGRDCYKVLDIKLNSQRLTHAQYLQLVNGAATTPAALFASETKSPDSDRCLWTFVKNQKVDMGSVQHLDVFVRQIGGECRIAENKDGETNLLCRFPDFQTHRTHELLLKGDNDGAGCYGITHTALDGKTLPFAKYQKIFIDHK